MIPSTWGVKELAILFWGVGGVIAFLMYAVARLIPFFLKSVAIASEPLHFAAYAVCIVLLAWYEGYKAFHLAFSPRVVARAAYVAARPTLVMVLLAPLMTMGLFHATRRRVIASWGVVIGVTILVLLVRLLEQPWRGAVDAGVIVGLSWGSWSMFAYTVALLRGRALPVGPDVPARS